MGRKGWSCSEELALSQHMLKARVSRNFEMKKRRRTISPHKANCHLPISNNIGTIITPSAKKGRIDNFRWYNIDLQETDGSCSPVDRKLEYNIKSKNLKIEKSMILEKAVMRRLVDNLSPSSEDKKPIVTMFIH